MQELIDAIVKNVGEEKERADKKWGDIRNAHEGYGILYEEVLEWKEVNLDDGRLENIAQCIHLDRMTRKDTNHFNRDCCAMVMLQEMRRTAIMNACEAVQVAAVCERFMEMLKKKEEGQTNG